MKRVLIIFCLFGSLLCACGQMPELLVPTWQEQYDLGVRYLEEGNYEEAIVAFTAAIEIDPKQALAYVGRGDAYIGSSETEENLTAALTDYKQALEIAHQMHETEISRDLLDQITRKVHDIELMLDVATTNRLYFDQNYFSEDTLLKMQAMIGGKNFIDLSYEEIATYYGAEEFHPIDDENQVAITSPGPDGPDPSVHIQKDFSSNLLFIVYSSRNGSGIKSDKNQPEFLNIKIGDSLNDAIKKIGMVDRSASLIKTAGFDHYVMNISLDHGLAANVTPIDIEKKIVNIIYSVDKYCVSVELSFDRNDNLTEVTLQRQVITN